MTQPLEFLSFNGHALDMETMHLVNIMHLPVAHALRNHMHYADDFAC